MPRPDTIRVGPVTWTVDYSSAHLAVLDKDDGENRYGVTDTQHSRIHIDGDNLGADATRETLLHEVLHAIFAVHGPEQNADLEETIVSILSPALLDTLQRNPALTAYLTSEAP